MKTRKSERKSVGQFQKNAQINSTKFGNSAWEEIPVWGNDDGFKFERTFSIPYDENDKNYNTDYNDNDVLSNQQRNYNSGAEISSGKNKRGNSGGRRSTIGRSKSKNNENSSDGNDCSGSYYGNSGISGFIGGTSKRGLAAMNKAERICMVVRSINTSYGIGKSDFGGHRQL